MSSSHNAPERRDDSGRRNDSGHRDDAVLHGDPASRGIDADSLVDSLLRNGVPPGTRRPDLASLFSDEAIDRALRDVPCRMTSLQPFAAGRGRRVPIDLDAAAADFDRRFFIRATRVASRSKRLVRSAIGVGRDALNVVAVLSVVVATFAASVLVSRWLSEPTARIAATAPHGLDFSASAPGLGDPVVVVLGDRRSSADGSVLADRGTDDPARGRSAREAAAEGFETVADASPRIQVGAGRLDDRRNEPEGVGDGLPRFSPDGPPTDLRASPVTGSVLGPWQAGSGRPSGRVMGDSLQVVASRPSVGRAVPYHRGYDLAFEMTRGESPFVDPSLTPALCVDRPPLSRRTDSFDRVDHLMAAGGLRRDQLRQAIARLRVEEVLAAVLPAAEPEGPAVSSPAAEPAVRLAGRPSISGRPATRLLEVSITAPPSSRPRPSGSVLFVLDASAAAGADEAWPAVCRGVEDAVRRLDPSASITVVVFAERPLVIARSTTARDLPSLRRRLLEIRPRGGGDLHGCMATVRRLVAEAEGSVEGENRPGIVQSPRCVVVAHGGSIARAERDGDPDLAAWRRSQQMARDGEPPTAAGGSTALRGHSGIQPVIKVVEIDAVAGATGEDVGRIGSSLLDGVGLDSIAMRRSIVAAVLGDDATPILEECRLEVTFDPSKVAAYRLVGHRRQVADMGASRSSAVDLSDGECVRAVYELVLRERGPHGRTTSSASSTREGFVAKATCRYRRRGDAVESSVVAGISASQLAVDPDDKDRAGQAVWLSVAVAELVAGSAHIESPQRLREALRRRMEPFGDASAGSAGDDPAAEAAAMLRRLHDIWTLL